MKTETEMKFVILSSGSYSDYYPTYYMGTVEITQEDLDQKGTEIGDMLLAEWNAVRRVHHVHEITWREETCDVTASRYSSVCPEFDEVDESGKKISKSSIDKKWNPLMEEWLDEKGYKKLPEKIPEINIYYDIPISKN